jgi:hypothetical protein
MSVSRHGSASRLSAAAPPFTPRGHAAAGAAAPRSSARPSRTTKRKVKVPAPRAALHSDLICSALVALRNNETVLVTESKSGTARTSEFDSGVLKAVRAMFPVGKQYSFRLCGQAIGYSTDGTGAILATTTFSPAVATFPEWSGLSALFDEIVLRKARLTLVGGASGLKNVGIGVGYNPNNISSIPVSTNAVTNLADSEMLSSYATTPKLLVKTVRIPSGRAWAETTVPAVASPPAGCVGTIDFATIGASGTVSSLYFYGLMEISVVFRNRI